jgi:hypothetical protein
VIAVLLYEVLKIFNKLNAFDVSRKRVTAWCENCNLVFDDRWTANSHGENKSHTVRISEFWITGKR